MSGGLDSFSFLGTTNETDDIYPISFEYGQKGSQECNIAKNLSTNAGFNPCKVVDLTSLKQLWVGTQLTDDRVGIEDGYMESVVVPLRNAVFLTIATAYAYTISAGKVMYGAHISDVGTGGIPLYPDCTPDFSNNLITALHKGHFGYWKGEQPIQIDSPSNRGLSKSDLVKIGYDRFGSLIFETWSCYDNQTKQCGICESCRNRKEAFRVAGIEDKTVYNK